MGKQTERRAALDALIGRVIAGKYRLRACVGLGASGAVFRADQISLSRTVAVKLLRPELSRDSRLTARFEREARAVSRLNHPNAVSVIDHGATDDGLLFLVLEYLDGRTVTELLAHEFPLPAARVVDLGAQILAGLEEAHHAGVVHADLKADNVIVVRRRRGRDLVKVIDFGIARVVGTPADNDNRVICGTPAYMAPEVIVGGEPTFASDIYAVGVLLYELLTGVTPFSGGSTVEILDRHLRFDPVPPSARRPELARCELLQQAVMTALAKNPAERYASCAELGAVLSAARRVRSTQTELCTSCGGPVSADFRFCPGCGTRRTATVVVSSDLLSAPTEELSGDDIDAALDHVRERSTAGAPDAPPFRGRDRELEAVARFFAGELDVPMLCITGARGSGRTRLCHEAAERAAETGVTVYRAAPDPTGLASAYYPIRALVAAALGLPPVCPFAELGAALEGAGLGRRDLPGLGELFGHPTELSTLEPPVRRRELCAATARVLESLIPVGDAALLFEDTDRYDEPSCDLVRRLAERGRLRIVTTSLAGAVPRVPDGAAALELGPLDRSAVAVIAEAAGVEGDGAPSPRALGELSRGRPGHLKALLRFFDEGGSPHGAPSTHADLVAARLDLLPRQTRELCQAVAVFGDEVPEEVLRFAAGVGVGGSFDRALGSAVRRGLLEHDGGHVGFVHHIEREVVYDATPADVRRHLHATAARVLAGSVSQHAVLGHHLEAAGELDSAADLLEAAGDAALHQLDDLGARDLYRRAHDAARRTARTAGEAAAIARFVRLAVKLSDALRAGGDVSLARAVLDEAADFTEDDDLLAAQILRGRARVAVADDNPRIAAVLLVDAIGLLIPRGAMDVLVDLYLDLGLALLRAGDAELARDQLTEGIDVVTLGEGAGADSGPDNLWRLLLRTAQLHGSVGDTAAALLLARHAAEAAEAAGSTLGRARAEAALAHLWSLAGNDARATHHRDRATSLRRELGDRRGTAELLLGGSGPTESLRRLDPGRLREAEELAAEIGWREGVARARAMRP